MSFKGKVAIITGGGQGIGETYAKSFAARGASVVIAELNEEAGQRVADEICQAGNSAVFVKPMCLQRATQRQLPMWQGSSLVESIFW